MAAATTVLSLWQGKDAIVETAVDLVKTFFSPQHVQSTTGPVKFECKLAPIFPDKTTLGHVSDNTKVMVAAANKRLHNKLLGLTNFQDIQGEINSNLQMVMSASATPENRSEIFTTEDKSFFQFTKSDGPSEASVKSIQQWIATKLLTDKSDLLASGLDDPKTIRGLITASKSGFDLFSNTVQDETLVADIGILAYPSKDHETISLSNIKIHVWIKDVNIGHGVATKYEVGLRGSYFKATYEANAEGIKALKEDTVTKAIEEYEKFMSEVDEFVKDRPAASDIGNLQYAK